MVETRPKAERLKGRFSDISMRRRLGGAALAFLLLTSPNSVADYIADKFDDTSELTKGLDDELVANNSIRINSVDDQHIIFEEPLPFGQVDLEAGAIIEGTSVGGEVISTGET